MTHYKKRYALTAAVSLLVLLCDQVTKYVICAFLPLYAKVEIITDFFTIVHIRNPGIAFGLLRKFGGQYKLVSLIVVSCIALFLLVFLISQIKKNDTLQSFSLSLILGGAMGNLIDRFRLGEVIDFIDVHWKSLYHWPAFNIADSAITVGIILIILNELRTLKRVKQKK